MTNIELPHFGQIDFTQLDEYYATEITLKGLKVFLDITCENKSISEEQSINIKKFLGNISEFDTQNRVIIDKNFKDGGEAKEYIDFYLEELDAEELEEIIGDEVGDKSKQLLGKLILIRVGLYPEVKSNSDYFGVFDYSIEIDGEISNQLLVVKTNEKGELDHITWES